ncbi:tectonic-like complex member MKS1 isoform X2 [Plodia interpunctella]|nr:tectonic-like complex member MKS1 isoform X2 [Plodia interpunctella]
MIQNSEYEPSKVFTYIHEDYYLPLPNSDGDKSNTSNVSLSSCMEKLKLKERVSRVVESSSMGDLFRSEDSFICEQWIAMHVVLDNSEYNEDSHILLKQEALLVSLYYNTAHNYVILSPNVNDLELNPYSVETATGAPLEYQYGIEVDFGEREDCEELMTLLHKLQKKCEKLQKNLITFSSPPMGRRQTCLTLEILSAEGFEMDSLYVEYHIKIPESMECEGSVRGRSHVSSSGGAPRWALGCLVELRLEVDVHIEPEPLQIFFEVISTDWWGRHRTEGYSYLPLTLAPGRHKKQLSCSRPEEIDKVKAESRRFFVGGCHLIKDLEVLAKPQLQNTSFTFVSTGTLSVVYDVVSQGPGPAAGRGALSGGAGGGAGGARGAAVLRGADVALRQYTKARARLAAATRDLPSDL